MYDMLMQENQLFSCAFPDQNQVQMNAQTSQLIHSPLKLNPLSLHSNYCLGYIETKGHLHGHSCLFK